jgi:hypothetical protein
LIPLPELAAIALGSVAYGLVLAAFPGTARDILAAVAPKGQR